MAARITRLHSFPPLPRPSVMVPTGGRGAYDAQLRGGVNLFAYFRGQFGLAEAARSYARALIDGGCPVALVDIDLDIPHDFGDRFFAGRLDTHAPYPVNIVFVNPDYFAEALDRIGPERLAGRPLIACWFWELPRVPTPWLKTIEQVNAIMVASDFVAEAFRAATDKPVFKVPLPLAPAMDSGVSRSALGLPEHAFLFLASFDFHSWVERKNPTAALRAFCEAFPHGDEPVVMVVKTSNGTRHPEAFQQLLRLAARDHRILVRDGVLERPHVQALQRCCDAYVSLHRSEGFGLALAECMTLGKPVIATAWSGNLEFMTPQNSCLVSYDLVPVGAGAYLHGDDQCWAEPDVGAAASWMKRLVAEPGLAASIGERARAEVGERLSEARCAMVLAEHLGDYCRSVSRISGPGGTPP